MLPRVCTIWNILRWNLQINWHMRKQWIPDTRPFSWLERGLGLIALKGIPLMPLVDVGTSLTLMSTIRLIMVHGVSTLRIKCWVSKISVHKVSTKWCFFVSHSSIQAYCQYMVILWKLDCNSATCTGPIPNTLFPIWLQEVWPNWTQIGGWSQRTITIAIVTW